MSIGSPVGNIDDLGPLGITTGFIPEGNRSVWRLDGRHPDVHSGHQPSENRNRIKARNAVRAYILQENGDLTSQPETGFRIAQNVLRGGIRGIFDKFGAPS